MHTGVLGGIAYVLAVCAALSGWQSVEAKVVYVTPLGSDSHDGLTWVTAKGSVYGGLAAAVSGDQVWVAAGTYVNARSTPYAVPSGVGLYGGFDGTETDLSRRDVDANKAILDGGAYTTVVSLFGSAAGTRIDGFTIRNGASSIGGGGIRCGAGSAATIANNTIIGNSAIGGGGVFCVSASPTILSNKIVGNSAVSGGGIGCYDSPSAMIANNTVVSNDAGPMGGGIECDSASITNNIIAFNSSGIHMRSGGEPVLRRNCVHGNTLGGYLGVVDPTGTEGNISVDPRLADVRYADLHIQPDSPCLDAGDDEALVPGGIDIDLQPRVQGEHVDIGADESDGTVWPPSSYVVVRVSTDGDDANDGASWSATKRTVQAAVQAASVVGGEVWVAGGTYLETVTLMRNVHVYGGFAGTESLRGQRDWAGRRTTLQAALYGSVVVAKDIGAGLCTIDGFTIRNGTGSHLATRLIGGGGILCWRSAPLIINCVVTCNAAPHLGGGIACYEYSSPRIVNCVIAGNSLGGIGCSSSSPSVINCTICNNEGGPYGGGLSASTSSYAPSCPAVVNTIVAMNSSGLRIMSPAPGYYLLSHNCIYGNGLNDYASIPDLTGIDGNISADPLLAAAEYGNFHLQPGSPCREAGDDVYVEAASTDMDGGLRIHGEHVDIGAYEAVGTQWAGEPNLIVRVSMIGDDENDGSSWALTKRTVQAALDTASHAGGQVWVKTGSYYESIVLLPYAHLRGGFAGTESAESQRDWIAHPTILEGSQGWQNVAVKHGYRLCSVDGFTIRHGWTGVHCETGSLALAHNLITANSGSGVNCENGSALVVNNIITANGGAGILCGYGSAPTIINNTITANVADEGGGIYSSTPGVRIINNLIAFNSSGIFYKGTQPSEVVVRHNCVYGNPGFGYSGIVDRTGTDGNISVDPKLADAGYGNLHIQPDSPCRDAGEAAYAVESERDADGDVRVQGEGLDIGADETNGTLWPVRPRAVVRVSPGGSDDNDGSAWPLAKRTVQGGIEAAAAVGGEVWVKRGVYSETIRLLNYTHVYGGFAGDEGSRDQRDWRSNLTVLEGPGGSVVTAKEPGYDLCGLDGFSIQNAGALASYGGGIYCSSSGPRIANNRIVGISVQSSGAGIYCDGSAPTIINNVIEGNHAAYSGGGILAYSSPRILGNIIIGNSAGRDGGGICCSYCAPLLAGNLIVGNVAKSEGGGVYWHDCPGSIVNCTIVGNSAGTVAGGVYLTHYRPVQMLANCIVAFNTSGIYQSGSAAPPLYGCCVFGNTESDYSGLPDLTGTDGNISLDPRFVSLGSAGADKQRDTPDDVARDLRLQGSSPCINAGYSTAVPQEMLTDVGGRPRFVDAPAAEDAGFVLRPVVDIGAYEYQAASAADFNDDGLVDTTDLEILLGCGTGPAAAYDPGGLPVPGGCTLWPGAGAVIPADFDGDGDVDQEDFGVLQRCYSGLAAVDPGCGG